MTPSGVLIVAPGAAQSGVFQRLSTRCTVPTEQRTSAAIARMDRPSARSSRMRASRSLVSNRRLGRTFAVQPQTPVEDDLAVLVGRVVGLFAHYLEHGVGD